MRVSERMSPVLSASGMKTCRQQQAVHRVPPARERLDARRSRPSARRPSAGSTARSRRRRARARGRPRARGGRASACRGRARRARAPIARVLAWYIATSARRSSSPAVSAWSGKSAIPTLASTRSDEVLRPRTAAPSAARILSATPSGDRARPTVRRGRCRTRRRRAARGCRPVAARPPSRGPIWRSSTSPLWWPSVSFSSLKWSRSTISTAMPSPARAPRAIASSSRCWNRRRFGSSVRSSVTAWRRASLKRAQVAERERGAQQRREDGQRARARRPARRAA